MKIFVILSALFSLFILTSCTPQKTTRKNSLSHTQKLQKHLSVVFKSQKELEIIKDKEDLQVSIKIYLKKDKQKKQVDFFQNYTNSSLLLNLPNDLSEYTYIIAVAEAIATNGDIMSSVDTYKIGEQDQINEAKKALKNRY